jgi:uncharacterized protein GlcG (DUF336 family)
LSNEYLQHCQVETKVSGFVCSHFLVAGYARLMLCLPVVFLPFIWYLRVVSGDSGAAAGVQCVFTYCEWSAAMKTKPVLTLDDVKKIAAAAEAEALANNWAVVIAIVDDGGHLLWLQRLDGTAPLSAMIAPAKATTAALGKRESKVYEDMINGGRFSFLSAPYVEGMLEGGVPVMVDGQCVGAVGVSGVKSAEDAQIAKAGIAALG